MAKRDGSDRVEPKFGGGNRGGPVVSPQDRVGRSTVPRRGRKAAKAARRSWWRRSKRTSGEGPRRSFLGRAFRRAVYWGAVLSLWLIIGVGALVAYYAAQLPGTSEWRVPERPPNIQVVAVDGTLLGNRGDTGGETVRVGDLPDYVPNAIIAIE